MRKKYIIIYSSLIVLMLIFIFGNSMVSGSNSGIESGFFAKIFINIFYTKFDSFTLARQIEVTEFSNHFVRKSAHVTEYLLLGVFTLLLLKELINKKTIFIYMPLFIYLIAALDEFSQNFTPDRGPSIKDTFIDLSGALVLDIIIFIYITIKRKKKKNDY